MFDAVCQFDLQTNVVMAQPQTQPQPRTHALLQPQGKQQASAKQWQKATPVLLEVSRLLSLANI